MGLPGVQGPVLVVKGWLLVNTLQAHTAQAIIGLVLMLGVRFTGTVQGKSCVLQIGVWVRGDRGGRVRGEESTKGA